VTIQENVIDLGAAGSALYQTSGAVVNTIPREGGNRFSGTGFGAYTNHNLQASNLSDDLKAWGLTSSTASAISTTRTALRWTARQGQVVVRGVGPEERQHAACGEPLPRREPDRLGVHARHSPAGRSG
jgi:hypothetical protein